jgi:hypothetical protein
MKTSRQYRHFKNQVSKSSKINTIKKRLNVARERKCSALAGKLLHNLLRSEKTLIFDVDCSKQCVQKTCKSSETKIASYSNRSWARKIRRIKQTQRRHLHLKAAENVYGRAQSIMTFMIFSFFSFIVHLFFSYFWRGYLWLSCWVSRPTDTNFYGHNQYDKEEIWCSSVRLRREIFDGRINSFTMTAFGD